MIVYLSICMIFFSVYPLVPRKHLKWLFAALVLALSVMAFYAVPAETDDLARYFETIDRLRDEGWPLLQRMIKNGNEHWNTLPVCGYYFYFISRFPDNGMLAATTIFLSYSSMFLVIWKAAEKYDVSKWYLFLACFFLLSTYWFYDICSGVRNGLAFTLFSAFIYFDVVEKKHRVLCWLGYLLMMGLHSSAILFAFIRLAMFLVEKINVSSKITNIFVSLGMILGGIIGPKLGDLTGIEYFELISEKAEGAMETSGAGGGTASMVNYSVFVVAFVVVIYGFYVIKKCNNPKYDSFKEYGQFIALMMSFMLGSVFFGLTFIRFARWVIPAGVSVFFMVYMQAGRDMADEIKKRKKNKSIIRSNSLVSSNEILINFCFIGYTCVHLWYTCAGSSLLFLHFS